MTRGAQAPDLQSLTEPQGFNTSITSSAATKKETSEEKPHKEGNKFMLKTRKRWISLLVAVAMVATLLVPFVGTASATATYSITGVSTVQANTTQVVGSLEVTMDPATANVANGQTLFLNLPSTPSGYALYLGTAAAVYDTSTGYSPAGISAVGQANGYNVTATASAVNLQTVKLVVTGIHPDVDVTSYELVIPLMITVPSGVTGNVTLSASAQGSTVYPSGSLVIASVGTVGLTLAVESTTAISSSGGSVGTVDVTENSAGSLDNYNAGGTPLKLTLPPGFTWASSWITGSVAAPFAYMWGDQTLYNDLISGLNTTAAATTGITFSNDGREMDVNSAYASQAALGGALFFKMTPAIVVDEATAATGNITVTVSGSATSNVSTFVIGTYGQYGATIDAHSAPTIGAGQTGDTIGELEVKEGIPGSLLNGRTITLTLPSGAVWAEGPTIDTNLSTNYANASFPSTMVGTNGNLMQITVGGNTTGAPTAGQSSAADVFLKSLEVSTAVDFSGPLAVTVGGSEGLTGTVTLAQVQPVITATVATPPNILIGQASQALGNLTITEGAAGDLAGVTYYTGIDLGGVTANDSTLGFAESTSTNAEPNLYIVAPEGVTFDTTPTVTVSSGNLQLGTVTTETSDTYLGVNNQGVIVIPIQSSSTTASTITISGIAVTVDNTVPEGPVAFKIEGPAVNQETDVSASGTAVPIVSTTAAAEWEAPFPNDTVAAKVTAGTVTNGIGTTSTSGTAVDRKSVV